MNEVKYKFKCIIYFKCLAVEGKAQDIGGYFNPDEAKAEAAMRPSTTLSAILDAI